MQQCLQAYISCILCDLFGLSTVWIYDFQILVAKKAAVKNDKLRTLRYIQTRRGWRDQYLLMEVEAYSRALPPHDASVPNKPSEGALLCPAMPAGGTLSPSQQRTSSKIPDALSTETQPLAH